MKFVKKEALSDSFGKPLALSQIAWVNMTERRRNLFRLLGGLPDDEVIPLRNVCDILTQYENDGTIDAQMRKRIYIAMAQNDLPTLDFHDIVEYDDRAKTVTTDENFSIVYDVLKAMESVIDDHHG